MRGQREKMKKERGWKKQKVGVLRGFLLPCKVKVLGNHFSSSRHHLYKQCPFHAILG